MSLETCPICGSPTEIVLRDTLDSTLLEERKDCKTCGLYSWYFGFGCITETVEGKDYHVYTWHNGINPDEDYNLVQHVEALIKKRKDFK